MNEQEFIFMLEIYFKEQLNKKRTNWMLKDSDLDRSGRMCTNFSEKVLKTLNKQLTKFKE